MGPGSPHALSVGPGQTPLSARHIAGVVAVFVCAVSTAAAGQAHGPAAPAAKEAPAPAAKAPPAPAAAPPPHAAKAEAAPAPKPAAPAAPRVGEAADIKAALERIDQRVRQVLATARTANLQTRTGVPAATPADTSATPPAARVQLRWRIDLEWPAEIEEQSPAPAEGRIKLAWR